ncbi:MAG: hypothetical protein AAGE89_16425 [Pseudomonadota bacterium]
MTSETNEADQVQAKLEADIQLAWQGLLAQEAGRLIVWSILEKCHLFETTYTGNAASNFLEGERSIGLKILQDYVLPAGMTKFTKILEEAEEREARIARALEEEDKDETPDT